MGFYSPQSLVDDARRHGVEVRRPGHQRQRRQGHPGVADADTGWAQRGRASRRTQWGLGGPVGAAGAVRASAPSATTWPSGSRQERDGRRPVPRTWPTWPARAGLTTAQLEALATADAFACFGLTRREALWAAGAAAQERPGPAARHDRRRRTRRRCPAWTTVDALVADVWATGLSPDSHPGAVHPRAARRRSARCRSPGWAGCEHGQRVRVGGIVTHRQRPATAGGITFINLEDETGMLNVICSPGLWQRYRRVARTSAALVVRGRLERAEGVINLIADRLDAITPPVTPASRDFR